MNEYYEKLKIAKSKIERYLSEIFKVYGNELLLRLEEYNLLANSHNCIETSTATGFILEEFIVSKLETYTQNHNPDEIKILRVNDQKTTTSSYDCYAIYKNIFIMINIKVQKNGSVNNAVAALNGLYNDYVVKNPNQEKAYLVLKTHYRFGESLKDSNRKILINKTESYFLEELDFSIGHMQDHRNWSENYNKNSGRLKVSDNWKNSNLLDDDKISYSQTREFIKNIFIENN